MGFASVGLLILLVPSLVLTAPLFRSNYMAYPGRAQAWDAAVGDFNIDGRDDFLVNPFSDSVAIFVSQPDGSLGAPVLFDGGANPAYSFVVGDLDGDAFPDLVVGGTQTFAVHLGRGDGTFEAPVVYSAGTGTKALSPVIGDLDQDGHDDVALLQQAPDLLRIFPGDGTGVFGAPFDRPLGAEFSHLEIGDVNRDDLLDLVAGGGAGFSVLLALGAGTFSESAPFGPGGSFLLADATGDTIPDILSDSLLMAGAGDGTFPTSVALELTPSGVADFDRDGWPDIAGTRAVPLGRLVAQQRGTGGGTFESATVHQSGLAVYSHLTRSGDFDGDGGSDIAAASYASNALYVLYGNGHGWFGDQQTFPGSGLSALADLDGDNRLDVITTRAGVSVFLGTGGGAIGAPTSYPAAGGVTRRLITADLDHDGSPDVITCFGLVSVWLGNGDGTLGARADYATGAGSADVAAGDVNGDTHADLVTSNNTGTPRLSILLGNGDGTFQSPTFINGPNRSFAVALGDMNSDGKLDIVDASSIDAIMVWLGDGAGGFAPGVAYAITGTARRIELGHLNADGLLDVVVRADNALRVLLGTGGGALGGETSYSVSNALSDLALAEVSGDGHLDAVVARSQIGAVEVLLGRGDGTFDRTIPYGSAGSSATPNMAVSVGDMDGNGALDLVAVSGHQELIGVLLSTRGPRVGVPRLDPRATQLALPVLRPHPARTTLRVVVRLADASPARLELFDVSGRRLRGATLDRLGPGEHVVDLGGTAGLRSSVYLLKLSQGGRHAVSRACVVK
jgi:hypothetical protein